jgi:diguanylate cyclase (GGDEF)-like protein
MANSEKILLIDDEPEKILIFTTILENHGFRVETAVTGHEGFEKIHTIRPDLILLDINMPDLNGHAVRQELKERPSTRYVPIVMFSSSDALNDKIQSLRSGADDYITKDVAHEELVARLESLIRRYKDSIGANPLTRLPGNHAIEEDINYRIAQKQDFSVCYADLDNFKAYNDQYGFKRGDDVIRLTADIILDTVSRLGTKEDFVGHIGGDDFVYNLVGYSNTQSVCQSVIKALDDQILQFYSEDDRKRGYIITKNRKDEIDRFPLIGISVAVVTNEHRTLHSAAQIAQIASEVKKVVKSKSGSNYWIDHRWDHE